MSAAHFSLDIFVILQCTNKTSYGFSLALDKVDLVEPLLQQQFSIGILHGCLHAYLASFFFLLVHYNTIKVWLTSDNKNKISWNNM